MLTWIRFAICDTDGEYEFKLKSLAKMLQEPWVKQEVRAPIIPFGIPLYGFLFASSVLSGSGRSVRSDSMLRVLWVHTLPAETAFSRHNTVSLCA